MIRLALRFDDAPSRSQRELEEAIVALAGNYRIPLTIAVVPFRCQAGDVIPLDVEEVPHLVAAHRLGLLEAALHGYCHKSHRLQGTVPPTEFADVDPSTQRHYIATGRALLAGIFRKAIYGFVPPWNTFDATTTAILAEVGFRYLSAGYGGALPEGVLPDLSYLPLTCQVRTLPMALQEIKPYVALDPVVIAVMHHYDFMETGDPKGRFKLGDLESLLREITNDPLIELATLGQLTQDGVGDLATRRRQNAWRRLPWRIQKRLPRHALFARPWPRLLLTSIYPGR